MLTIKTFVFNPFEENTYVVYDETKACFIVDPGCSNAQEEKQLADFIEQQQLKVTCLLNTHCHIDHVLGNAFVKKKYNTQLFIHTNDLSQLKAVGVYAPNYGIVHYEEAEPDGFLQENEEVKLNTETFKILYTPGHAPGHVVFYNEANNILIGGDVLFHQSIGRTDLPGGNFKTLIDSIHQKLFTLPDDTTVYPGHGITTTIGFEKKTNPFCALN